MRYLFIALIMFASSFEAKALEKTDSSLVTTSACSNPDKASLKKLYKQTVYWKRYRIYKATGWSMLGVGLAGAVGCTFGAIIDGYTNANYKASNERTWSILIGTGLGLAVCSIPVLTLAYKNKANAKKSVRLSTGCSSICVEMPTGDREVVPSLGVCLNF